MLAKRGEPHHVAYEIDITQNPFISDTLRDYVMRNRHLRHIRQEYFCEFSSSKDQLFEPTLSPFYPQINPASPNQFLVV